MDRIDRMRDFRFEISNPEMLLSCPSCPSLLIVFPVALTRSLTLAVLYPAKIFQLSPRPLRLNLCPKHLKSRVAGGLEEVLQRSEPFMNLPFQSRHGFARAFSVGGALALVANSFFVAGVAAQTPKGQAAAQKLTEEQRIVHVLNRLAFGARPGDIERVRKMGLENYIEQQLNPSKIDDSLLEAKLRNLPTLQMSNGELLAKYPQPNQILRRLQRTGQLPPELAALVQQRQQGQPAQGQQAQSTQQNNMQDDKAMPEKAGPPTVDAERIVGEAMNAQANPQAARQQAQDADPQRRAYRQAVMEDMP